MEDSFHDPVQPHCRHCSACMPTCAADPSVWGAAFPTLWSNRSTPLTPTRPSSRAPSPTSRQTCSSSCAWCSCFAAWPMVSGVDQHRWLCAGWHCTIYVSLHHNALPLLHRVVLFEEQCHGTPLCSPPSPSRPHTGKHASLVPALRLLIPHPSTHTTHLCRRHLQAWASQTSAPPANGRRWHLRRCEPTATSSASVSATSSSDRRCRPWRTLQLPCASRSEV